MSLLSKLFGGDKDAEKAAKDLLNSLFSAANASNSVKKTAGTPEERDDTAPAAQPDRCDDDDPSGFSWGEKMPAEENQYNFGGTFEQYFEHVFAEDFPSYGYEKSYIDDYGKHRVVYTFISGGAKALIVELMPEKSSASKFRNECIKAGVPYLRFYYDHDGWWNTRAYVVERIRGALK